jgi:hypothetical protein
MDCGIPARILLLALVLGGCAVSCNRLKKGNGAHEEIAQISKIQLYEKNGTESDGVYQFLAGFYEWYVLASSNKSYSDLLDLKEMRSAIAPELLQAIKEDSAAQQPGSTEESAGLMLDPFTSAVEEPCERCIVGRIIPHGKVYWAEIHQVTNNSYNVKPDFTAEVAKSKGSWLISNFYYPDPSSTDLRSMLAGFRRERSKK